MSLTPYFQKLVEQVEQSDIGNNGTDENGFFLPVRTILLRHLQRLIDLHEKPGARAMVRSSWDFVRTHVPPEWLILNPQEKSELRAIFSPDPKS